MVDVDVFKTEIAPPRKIHPKVEEMKTTGKLFLSNKLALVGFTITSIYFLIAILDVVYPQYLGVANDNTYLSWVPGRTPVTIPPSQLGSPSLTPAGGWMYIFGTTFYNMPIFPAMLAALKFDLGYSLAIVLVGGGIGVVIGVISGYIGGIFDEVMMRVTDIFFSVPFLVLAIAFLFVFGHVLSSVVFALVIIWWPIYARLTRGQALSTKALNYVESAKAAGSSRLRNIFVHVLPNVLSPVYVQFSLDLGTIVLIFSTLDFLGIVNGNPYTPELGSMIVAQGYGLSWLIAGYWWPAIIPGIFLLIFTISVNLMGDGLRDVLDPKLRR